MRARRDIRRELRRLAADERGISIVFAMLLLVVLLILGGIIMSYGLAGYQRAQQDVTDDRSYENVESAARFVYRQFADEASWTDRAIASLTPASDPAGQEGQGPGEEPAGWTLRMLETASASTNPVDRTLSVSGGNFENVTVRVRRLSGDGITYDVTCFESDEVDGDGRLTGVAFHFSASYDMVDTDNDTAKDMPRITVGDRLEKVGQ